MKNIVLLLTLIAVIAAAMSCGGKSTPSGAGSDTPTEAYKRLFAAVKAKDIAAIKQELSSRTIELGKVSMQRFSKTEQQAYENGFTATTSSDTLPTIRDERMKDNFGAVEVWNTRESKWDDIPFVAEDGKWKLAMGDAFNGVFRSPGKGRDFLEKEAANAMRGPGPSPESGPPDLAPPVNANAK